MQRRRPRLLGGQWSLIENGSGQGGAATTSKIVHLRHAGFIRANVTLADGHVETKEKEFFIEGKLYNYTVFFRAVSAADGKWLANIVNYDREPRLCRLSGTGVIEDLIGGEFAPEFKLPPPEAALPPLPEEVTRASVSQKNLRSTLAKSRDGGIFFHSIGTWQTTGGIHMRQKIIPELQGHS